MAAVVHSFRLDPHAKKTKSGELRDCRIIIIIICLLWRWICKIVFYIYNDLECGTAWMVWNPDHSMISNASDFHTYIWVVWNGDNIVGRLILMVWNADGIRSSSVTYHFIEREREKTNMLSAGEGSSSDAYTHSHGITIVVGNLYIHIRILFITHPLL